MTASNSEGLSVARAGLEERPSLVPVAVALLPTALLLGEALGVILNPIVQGAWDSVLVLALLQYYALARGEPAGYEGGAMQSHPLYHVPLVLALVPLLRVLSVTMPVPELRQPYWYALDGFPLLVAVATVARAAGISRSTIGLGRPACWAYQALIALTGIPLGVAAYLILRPPWEGARAGWPELLLYGAMLLVFSGFTEEIVFRGMVQRALQEAFGTVAILWSSAAFAIMYIGSLSAAFVLFIGCVGLFFGWLTRRTGSILGVGVAHGGLSVGMFLVWPHVFH